MKIKNISSRIVHIGTTTILPDEIGTVDDSLKNAPVVAMFVERGDIQIIVGKGAGKAGKGGRKAPGERGNTEGGNGDGNGSEDGDDSETGGQ